MPPNLCAALRGFIFANETVTLSVGRAPKTLLSFGRRYSRRFVYSGDFSRNTTRIGSSRGRGSRGQLYPTGTGACGTVCQNSGSWPKKMRAPLRSNAPNRSSGSQHRLALVHVTRQTAQRVVSGTSYAKRLARIGGQGRGR